MQRTAASSRMLSSERARPRRGAGATERECRLSSCPIRTNKSGALLPLATFPNFMECSSLAGILSARLADIQAFCIILLSDIQERLPFGIRQSGQARRNHCAGPIAQAF